MHIRLAMSLMTEDVFKAPQAKKAYLKTEDTDLWSPKSKRRRRTKDDFVKFCNIVLAYTQYDAMKHDAGDDDLMSPSHHLSPGLPHGLDSSPQSLRKHDELRRRHNSSPLDSGGSTADSVLSDVASDSGNNSIITYIDDNGKESVAEEEESQDLITCYCMKPFAGRPMIECSACCTWIHLSCAKIRKTNIPDEFVCQRCRDNQYSSKRKSQRDRPANNAKRYQISP